MCMRYGYTTVDGRRGGPRASMAEPMGKKRASRSEMNITRLARTNSKLYFCFFQVGSLAENIIWIGERGETVYQRGSSYNISVSRIRNTDMYMLPTPLRTYPYPDTIVQFAVRSSQFVHLHEAKCESASSASLRLPGCSIRNIDPLENLNDHDDTQYTHA